MEKVYSKTSSRCEENVDLALDIIALDLEIDLRQHLTSEIFVRNR
jgi:hypothetical protein